ncbi:GNAT family N-acetyltransferase [uncultured Jatrophihabitans sp.]|uniref:GNAT family N-acetyltransferase n=1 Tax=uncultured Jatrophihabitans sp. TaxID=1610747 RepID=UPI0035CB74CF
MPVDERVLQRLLTVAVDDADPSEVMAPVFGPPGWTPARRDAFLRYHRERWSSDPAAPLVEVTYAVVAGDDVAGAIRLAAVLGDPAALEVGLWLGRSRRGRRIAGAALDAAADVALDLGAQVLVAVTSPTNAAALAVLRSRGFRVEPPVDDRSQASLAIDTRHSGSCSGRTSLR